MDFGLGNEDLNQIVEVFKRRENIEQVIVFGSRAMGNYKPGSDIDLAVCGSGVTFNEILELYDDLECLGLLYKFDLQNMNAIKDVDVLSHIQRAGKVLYPAIHK